MENFLKALQKKGSGKKINNNTFLSKNIAPGNDHQKTVYRTHLFFSDIINEKDGLGEKRDFHFANGFFTEIRGGKRTE
jgi:hypothetical protein